MSASNQSSLSIKHTSPNTESDLSDDKAAQHLPPRLQHSPSLPNLRFPPLSAREVLQLSPTKTDGAEDNPLKTPLPVDISDKPHLPRKSLQHRETQSIDDVASYLRQQTNSTKKTHKRRATGKPDPSQALLTPPLTPSSSMKTSTSIDSTVDTHCDDGNERATNSEATRFLYLSNVRKTVSSDALRANIIGALLTGYAELSASIQCRPTSMMEPFDERAVKGVFLRRHQTDGIVLLAFWDVRHAEIALRILSSPNGEALSDCVEDNNADGSKTWICCQFISGDELAEITGSSSFQDSTSGSFRIAVEDTDEEQGHRVVDDRSDGEELTDSLLKLALTDTDDKTPTIGKDRLDPTLLLTFLNSFGDVKACNPSDQLDAPKIFNIEYFSIIDAINAYRTIDGKDLFGMKIKVFGREREADEANLNSWVSKSSTQPIGITPSSMPIDMKQHLSVPGQSSQMRRSFYGGNDGEPRSHGQDNRLGPSTTSSSPSPVVLYTTTPQESHTQSHTYPHIPQCIPPIQHQHSVNGLHPFRYLSPHGNGSPPRVYSPQGIDYSHSAYTSGYYYPQPPSTPDGSRLGYFPPQSPFPMTPEHASLAVMSHYSPRGYDYYTGMPGAVVPTVGANSHPWIQPTMNPPHQMYDQNWAFTDVAQNVGTPSGLNSWSPPQSVSGGRSPSSRNSPNRLHGTTPLMRRSPLHPSRENPSQIPPERNQLNLSRIEDGQDTRTTVMIKNIPNKMSDKDLIAYIGNVCPRRIDFLYLRMDFSNGCNVGYAFVNFITVQDLLIFAREKLGEKWNMFSSEKVLQMSYANYQGKEALVEKFKNSCIMDEKEPWRPKIFYSEPGPEQGLSEPFPAPTHMRRKERSSFNRGALFVPGIGGHRRTGSSTLFHAGNDRHGHGSRDGRGDRRDRSGGRRGKPAGSDIDGLGAFGYKHGRNKGKMSLE